ncbi:MAG: (d)CMP kinase [Magnetococcales bacterium]|nr:(d)CMP kinase [Magnetococcales bacterium]
MNDTAWPAKGDRLVVAVDGPAGAGKGAVCRSAAQRFGLAYLETGALYRAVGLIGLRNGLTDADALARVAGTMPFGFRALEDGRYGAYLGEEEVTLALRAEEVGQTASKVAAMPGVRAALLSFQRRYGGGRNVILDGRDVGSVVWPDADLKIFLTASLEERARRRAVELQARGEAVNLTELLARMAERDARDAGRAYAPMAAAPGAILVDTSPLTLEESCQAVWRLIAPLLEGHARI